MLKYILSFALTFLFVATAKPQINILSGPDSEVYHRFASDIRNNTTVNLIVLSSEGSLDNFVQLQQPKNHLALMQYDVLLKKEIDNPKVKEHIKLFLPLYEEEVHVLVRNNNRINSLADLQNKRIGIGSENSGSFVTLEFIRLLTNMKWQTKSVPFDQALNQLMLDSIDAYFVVVAAPSPMLKSLSIEQAKLIKLLPVKDERLEDFYIQKKLSKNFYPWVKNTVETFAVKTVIVINTNNLDTPSVKQLDRLYADLKENLKGIQMNKFSHPKWLQVDFANMKGIDWPVYKEEFVTYVVVFNWLAYIAVLLTLFQVYFLVNKYWTRKHERLVAESISISAMIISITINGLFAFKNLINDGAPQLIANAFWIVYGGFSILLGVGYWVGSNKNMSFFILLKRALKLEKSEAADLAKAFFRPSGAEYVIDILGRIAMVDEDLDAKEKEYIQGFADQWGISIDWEDIRKYADLQVDRYEYIRNSMEKYLNSDPPEEQASQLSDVLNILVNIDGKVTDEEETILTELQAQVALYIGAADGVEVFKVALVPQSIEEEEMIKNSIVELSKENIAGGFAYLSEPFYSEKYAEIVSAKYRKLNVFSVVFKPDHFKNNENLQQIIDQAQHKEN